VKQDKEKSPSAVRGNIIKVQGSETKRGEQGVYRLVVEIPRECVPDNIGTYLDQAVAVYVLDRDKIRDLQIQKKTRPYYKVGNTKVKRWKKA